MRYQDAKTKNDRELVRVAIRANPLALKYASSELRSDKRLVRQAVHKNPQVLQYIDPVLRSTFLLENFDLGLGTNLPSAVLSVRHSWSQDASMISARMHSELQEALAFIHWYSPNTFTKKFCGSGSQFADKSYKCAGLGHGLCRMKCKAALSGGVECQECERSEKRTTDHSCWRFSFRDHMEIAKSSGGFLLQILEWSDEAYLWKAQGANNYNRYGMSVAPAPGDRVSVEQLETLKINDFNAEDLVKRGDLEQDGEFASGKVQEIETELVEELDIAFL